MLVVPPELLLYIATASEEKYVYNIAGPSGPEKFEAGVAGYEARSFRGCGVVTSSPFEISDDADSLQMLQRNTQIGEFYRMRAPSIKFEDGPKHAHYLDIVIYNEDSDMHTHISFEEALKASCLVAKDKDEGPWVNPKDGKKYTMEELIENNKKGVWMPVSLVIARPFIEHRMMSAVLAVAGTDTGATLFGPADMQISANTSVKTIEGCVFAPSRHTRCPAPWYVRLLTAQPLPRQALHVRRFCEQFSRWHRLCLRPAHPAASPTGATPSRSSPSRRT